MLTVAIEQMCPIFIILLLMIYHSDILLEMTFVFLLDYFQLEPIFSKYLLIIFTVKISS